MARRSTTSNPVCWDDVAGARHALVATLEQAIPDASDARWDAPSLAGGWRVRDVLAHLVFLAEGTRPSVFAAVARERRGPDAALDRIARRLGATAPDELLRRLRAAADGTFVLPGLGPTAALGEVVVHGVDLLVPIDVEPPPVAPAHAEALVTAMVRLWPAYSRNRAIRTRRFLPDDASWSVGRSDATPVHGSTLDLLLIASGRGPLPDGDR